MANNIDDLSLQQMYASWGNNIYAETVKYASSIKKEPTEVRDFLACTPCMIDLQRARQFKGIMQGTHDVFISGMSKELLLTWHLKECLRPPKAPFAARLHVGEELEQRTYKEFKRAFPDPETKNLPAHIIHADANFTRTYNKRSALHCAKENVSMSEIWCPDFTVHMLTEVYVNQPKLEDIFIKTLVEIKAAFEEIEKPEETPEKNEAKELVKALKKEEKILKELINFQKYSCEVSNQTKAEIVAKKVYQYFKNLSSPNQTGVLWAIAIPKERNINNFLFYTSQADGRFSRTMPPEDADNSAFNKFKKVLKKCSKDISFDHAPTFQILAAGLAHCDGARAVCCSKEQYEVYGQKARQLLIDQGIL